MVAGFEVDFAWREQRLVVELDSRTFQERRLVFEADRVRDSKLVLAGYRPIRVTHRRLASEPAAVEEMLRALLRLPLAA
jgi:very-short-patch-repair endonuclease